MIKIKLCKHRKGVNSPFILDYLVQDNDKKWYKLEVNRIDGLSDIDHKIVIRTDRGELDTGLSSEFIHMSKVILDLTDLALLADKSYIDTLMYV